MRNKQMIHPSDDTRQFLHGKRADYCVYGDGTITRTWKKSWIEEVVKPYLKRGKLTVKCGGKEFIVKHLVAWAFLPEYKKGLSVVCVDSNERNCAIDNICVISAKQLGRITGGTNKKCKKMFVSNSVTGRTFRANSARAAAKEMNCSYQTLLDYIAGKSKNSVLSDYRVEVLL